MEQKEISIQCGCSGLNMEYRVTVEAFGEALGDERIRTKYLEFISGYEHSSLHHSVKKL